MPLNVSTAGASAASMAVIGVAPIDAAGFIARLMESGGDEENGEFPTIGRRSDKEDEESEHDEA
jgi:hypothetical protein